MYEKDVQARRIRTFKEALESLSTQERNLLARTLALEADTVLTTQERQDALREFVLRSIK